MKFISRAIQLAAEHSASGNNGPFGAVIVKDDKIIAEGWNRVVELNDPTAHAEMNAIKSACQSLQTPDISGATLYTSCEPCPMCLAATYWAGIDTVIYACDRHDAEAINFDDNAIYQEMQLDNPNKKIKLTQESHKEGLKVFEDWKNNEKKIMY